MEINNISGSDVIPSGFSVETPKPDTNVSNETRNYTRERVPEENKGNNVDVTA